MHSQHWDALAEAARWSRNNITALPFCKVALQAQKPLPRAYPKQLKNIGDHLKKRRLDLKLRQEDVAKRLGATSETIRNWEKDRANPSLLFLPKIIESLGYVPFDMQSETLGGLIATYRKLLGLSQKELAHRVGVDPCTVQSWAKGRHKPTGKHLQELHSALSNTWP
jgi:transcriptional regulator with XRE-family HTH domain